MTAFGGILWSPTTRQSGRFSNGKGTDMDQEAFESDVWQSVNESTYTDQWGSLDDSSPDGDYTGMVFTVGETWQGTLYGTEENTYGQRAVYRFETETGQREWFDAVAGA